MVQSIYFTKMHGLGNDFVIVDSSVLPVNLELPKLITRIANRFIGIGCDQFITYTHVESNNYLMSIYNQDGSSAETCGNASRCLTKLIYNQFGHNRIFLILQDRKLECKAAPLDEFSVNMGQVSFEKAWMPTMQDVWDITDRFQLERKEVICADVGNPHIIIFSKLNSKEQEIISLQLQNSSLFPEGVNVDFADIIDNQIYLTVFERGAGLTLACGSGACVSFAAAHKLGFVSAAAEVIFQYGKLKMSKSNLVGGASHDIIMTGPASLIATGEFYYD